MNGVDAVVIATGNDFRATEACAHAYAAKSGKSKRLTHCTIDNGIVRVWTDVPPSVGAVGGWNNLHPLVKCSLSLLGKPSAQEFIRI